MKYLYCTWCILLLYLMSFGQENTNEVLRPKKTIVKFSVLSHAEGEPVLQFGVEHIFKPKLSIQQQLGYVYHSPVSRIWGIRSRSEIRSYFDANAERAQGYVAAEVLYKFLQNYGNEEFWRADSGYQERIDFRAKRNTIGFMPKIGVTNNVFKINLPLTLPLALALKPPIIKVMFPVMLHSILMMTFSGIPLFLITISETTASRYYPISHWVCSSGL